MSDKAKNNKVIVKDKQFSFRTTETVLNELQEISDKKEMTKTEMIEFLIRREKDRMDERK